MSNDNSLKKIYGASKDVIITGIDTISVIAKETRNAAPEVASAAIKGVTNAVIASKYVSDNVLVMASIASDSAIAEAVAAHEEHLVSIGKTAEQLETVKLSYKTKLKLS